MSSFSELPIDHFAHSWPVPGPMKSNEEVTALGVAYAAAGAGEKQEILLEIAKAFHSFILKYTVMISRGHVQTFYGHMSKDTVAALKFFLPKGLLPTNENLAKTARTLHLAFKGMDAGEVYDTLSTFLIRAVQNYDPYYADKVKAVVECINEKIGPGEEFIAEKLELDFDATTHLRLLVRKNYLKQLPVENSSRNLKRGNYKRPASKKAWPPPKKFLNIRPIGLTHHIQIIFRGQLQHFIDHELLVLENRVDMMQLENIRQSQRSGRFEDVIGEPLIPSLNGDFVGSNGKRWLADMSGMNSTTRDLQTMNLQWVAETKDPLFSPLTKSERWILYMHFVQSLTWQQIAEAIGISHRNLLKKFDCIMDSLRDRAGVAA